MDNKPSILFVVNVDWFFISHRLILAKAAVENGYTVYVAATDTGRRTEIEAVGAEFVAMDFDRSGTNPLKEIKTILALYKLYKKLNPSIVQHITLKPVSYGSVVSRILNIPSVNAISGLGYAFQEGKRGLSTLIMTATMKFGFNQNKVVCIFQNRDDLATVQQRGIINQKNEIVLIKGAGVNLDEFKFSPAPLNQKLKIILPARLLWDKGIREFKEASDLLKDKYSKQVQFQLVGMADEGNRAGVQSNELQEWLVDEYFEWIHYQQDMFPVYRDADIVVLPSYREGMPKTLLEACAVGRPIVTTSAIGCKECVDEGVNGFKVEPRSGKQLAIAIEKLINSKELREEMGRKGRKKAEVEFNAENVISKHLEIYSTLINAKA